MPEYIARVITEPAELAALPDERCVSCGLGIADDRYRDLDGDVWHGECFTQWCDAQEAIARAAREVQHCPTTKLHPRTFPSRTGSPDMRTYDQRCPFDDAHALVTRRIRQALRYKRTQLGLPDDLDLRTAFELKPVISDTSTNVIGSERRYQIVQWGVFVGDRCTGYVAVSRRGRTQFLPYGMPDMNGRIYDETEQRAHPIWRNDA
ncbi:hypothetical protein IU436_27435 [Nocardia farcinica]|uniref:hypothetical protein n=1 Tax=Nocardia TaxID=1817 RepID=UPI001894C326|nr:MULTISPECIES: hypothetical protein [Nocardia]MBF6215655.1 hypothetical protein [Nocardia puris]MBF6422374.1 hypothetical protein [Nocardia farcinica]MBF6434075.1 hypothetical protein [Nocardia farcinica]MBF6505131.1 hypothetical protein [Nocardia farcinica]